MENKIIPKKWVEVRLGNIANITTGKKDVNEGDVNGVYPFFTCSQKEHRINDYSFDTEAILVAGNAYFNVKYYKGRFDAYQRTYVIDGFKENIAQYIYYVVSKDLTKLTTNNQGSAVKYIKLKDLTDFKFLLPPMAEREKIINIFHAVDSVIDRTHAVIDQTQVLKKGLMQDLFTRGIPGRHKNFKRTKIGEIPENWDIKKLNDISTKIVDGVHRKPDYVEGGIPFLTVRNLTAGPEISFKDTSYITEIDHEEYIKRANPEKGDILITKDGTLGVPRVVETDRIFSIFVSLALIKPNREIINSHFLRYAIESPVISCQFGLTRSGSALKHIHLIDLRKTRCPLPSLAEQNEIIEILQTIEEKERKEIKFMESISNFKSALMQVLLTGEVRVKT